MHAHELTRWLEIGIFIFASFQPQIINPQFIRRQKCSLFKANSLTFLVNLKKKYAKSLQLCLNLCNPMNCSLSGSSIHGILQARILEWVAMASSRGSSRPTDRTCISCIAGRLPLGPAEEHQNSA